MESSTRNNNNNNSNNNNNNSLPPREVLILISTIQKLQTDIQSLLQIFTQCILDRSKIYQEQLKQSRERSNMGTRNALQVSNQINILLLLLFIYLFFL